MKKKMIILLLVLAATTALVQPAAAQANPARKVLFTLNPGEVIYQTEYFASASLNGYKFAAVLRNTQTDEYTFVFNGKRVFTGGIGIPYINPNEENGYIYQYELAGQGFTNYKGKVMRLYLLDYDNGNFTYLFGASYYARINDKTWGPYKYVWSFSVADNGSFGFAYKDNDGKEYALINDKTWGPYERAGVVSVTDNGSFGFAYRDNDWKAYARINDKTWGPYKDVGSVSVTDNGSFGFAYRDNDYKWYALINDKTWGPYNDVRDVSVAGNGNFGFAYEDNDGNYYARINDKTWGPYNYVRHVSVAGNGNFGFDYRDNDGKYYARINDKTWGPYKDVSSVSVAGNGNFGFSYGSEDGYWYRNINGKEAAEPIEPFRGAYSTSATSSDGQHDFYSGLNYEYVVIDGRKVGRSPALRVWYNKQSHSFVWNSIEERELVVYEYKL
jgi:hypothetical protein